MTKRVKVNRVKVNRVDGLYFRQWRVEAGLSLRAFCSKYREATGVSLADSNLSAMEQGRRPFPDEVIVAGSAILGRTPADFPEYRLRNIATEILTDPFADQLLRKIASMDVLDLDGRAELKAAGRLLEFMEEERRYVAEPAEEGPKRRPPKE